MQYKELSPEWQACFGLARSAFEHGSLPIGALVVDSKGKYIARSAAHMVYGSKKTNMTQHAEIEALAQIPVPDLEQRLTMYCTVEPCPMCFGAVNVARVAELHYGTRDPWAGSTNLVNGNWYMQRKQIDIQDAGEDFERIIAAWIVYAMLKDKDGDSFCALDGEFLDRWSIVVPDLKYVLPRMLDAKIDTFKNDAELFAKLDGAIGTIHV